jgi:hypothetical protein
LVAPSEAYWGSVERSERRRERTRTGSREVMREKEGSEEMKEDRRTHLKDKFSVCVVLVTPI